MSVFSDPKRCEHISVTLHSKGSIVSEEATTVFKGLSSPQWGRSSATQSPEADGFASTTNHSCPYSAAPSLLTEMSAPFFYIIEAPIKTIAKNKAIHFSVLVSVTFVCGFCC